jgi:hypothetical protein
MTIDSKSLIIYVSHHKVHAVYFSIKSNVASHDVQKSPYGGKLLHTFVTGASITIDNINKILKQYFVLYLIFPSNILSNH